MRLPDLTFIEWLIIAVIIGILVAVFAIESECDKLKKQAPTFRDTLAVIQACKTEFHPQPVYIQP